MSDKNSIERRKNQYRGEFPDKPFFSYRATIPFALKGGITVTAARMPSVLAGIMTIILVFVMGRALFGGTAGFLAAMILLTSFMFIFWTRTASSEILNLLGIWCMLWIFLYFTLSGSRRSHYILPLMPALAEQKRSLRPFIITDSIFLEELRRGLEPARVSIVQIQGKRVNNDRTGRSNEKTQETPVKVFLDLNP